MDSTKMVRWHRALIGVVVLLLVGIIYAWSIIKAPFEVFWDAGALGFNHTLAVMFFSIGGFSSGVLTKRLSSSLRLMIAAVLIFFSFLITSGIDGSNIIILYLAYGVMMGLGVGITYNTIISTTNAWFPDKQGFCSGVLLTGFGTSPLIIGRLADIMGRSELVGWSRTYLIFAIIIGVVLFIAALLVKPPPEGTVFPEPKRIKKASQSEEGDDISPRELLKSPGFYIVFAITSFLSFSGNAAISFARNILTDVGASATFAVTVVGLIAVSNGVGRLVAGWLFDNIGLKKTRYVYSVVGILPPIVIAVALAMDSLFLGVLGVCLAGLGFGFTPTAVSVFVRRFFGAKNFSFNFGMMSLVLVPASFSAALTGSVKEMTGEFLLAFIILSVIAAAGSAMNLVYRMRD